MKVYIGSDHAGWRLKEQLKKYLTAIGVEFEDLGNTKLDPKDDYPDYAEKVAQRVAKEKERGILICDSGVGVAIVANKVKGIRAVNAQSEKVARRSREDDDTNVLCLGQDYVSPALAKKIMTAWLRTLFSTAPRHQRRVDKIKRIEK